ncbi:MULTISPECIES: replication protein RepA [Pseudomonas syringae group]|uniref:Plasmid encoded RepA protein n=1 Tax=Pseudomonas syringae pv. persicae TaxID=237306 RepID=A0A3M4AR61_9PSED|nr:MULTISPECIES: replication protein RepA [Pseudomonas syringae group]QOQ33550.1 hypothetical protein [Pseudomonas syringae pv. actinidiae]RMP09427.1 hypothetical protein ALQ30_200346 [Pseudomonas syringae pv. persicae]
MSLLQFLSKEQRDYAEQLMSGETGLSVAEAIDVAQRTNFKARGAAGRKASEAKPLSDLLAGLPSGAVAATKPKTSPIITDLAAARAMENQPDTTELATRTLTAQRARKAKDEGKGEKPRTESLVRPVWDYRCQDLPARIRDLIEAHLQIEADDAKSAGNMGFMTRALAIATLPHRKTDDYRFVRRNGDFTLTMLTAHPEGLPFGTLPRLLLTWVATEVVQKREPVLFLGNTLADYLQELGLHSTGGKRGDITRLKHAMTTLFSAIISCHYDGRDSWALSNVLLADKVEWWKPQAEQEAGSWQSRLVLSQPFFKECIEHPVPIDLRAMKVLRQSPLALDIYVWLTHRMSYLRKRTTIPWWSLTGQFGSGYAQDDQGLRDFRRAFLRELKKVVAIYPEAKVSNSKNGLVLYPSPTHVLPAKTPSQPSFQF